MVLVKSWLKEKLDDIEAKCKEDVLKQQNEMRSRLGPELVIFDIDFSSTVRIANDRLSVRSQGSFNTIKANVCVYEGRWMYEVINVASQTNRQTDMTAFLFFLTKSINDLFFSI